MVDRMHIAYAPRRALLTTLCVLFALAHLHCDKGAIGRTKLTGLEGEAGSNNGSGALDDPADGCNPGAELCGNICALVAENTEHCGSCDTACADGSQCIEGKCTAVCSAGAQACGERCVDVLYNPNNCGACGVKCAAGEMCDAGSCVTNCGGGLVACDNRCSDLAESENNCGTCGNTCASNELCLGGDCVLSCQNGATACDDGCADFATDENHCGDCNTVCSSGQVCSGGECVTNCGTGTNLCGEACVDFDTNPHHCGDCVTDCGSGVACVNGVCNTCPVGQTLCGSTCVDLQNDADHCGACNIDCLANQQCNAGVCGCAAGLTLCGDTCRDLQNDSSTCGSCNNICASDRFCRDGGCLTKTTCQRGQTSEDINTYCSYMPNDTPIDNAVCGGVIEVAAASYSYDHSSDAIRAESMVAPGTGALSEKEFLLFDGLTTVPTGVCCGGSVLQYNLRSTGNVIMESSQVLVASTMPPSSAAVGLESAAQQEVCARPSTVHITSTNPWSAALAVRRMQHQGKFNEGTICDNPAQTLEQCINDSVQFVALSPSGNSCDHVCGMIGPETTACAAPSDRRFYKVTIPARQALEINANFRTGPGLNLDGNGDIFMYDDNGTDLNCRVRNASNYYQDTPENRQARLVNNTDAPMTVVLAPRHLSFAPMYYNFAVGIHPNP